MMATNEANVKTIIAVFGNRYRSHYVVSRAGIFFGEKYLFLLYLSAGEIWPDFGQDYSTFRASVCEFPLKNEYN